MPRPLPDNLAAAARAARLAAALAGAACTGSIADNGNPGDPTASDAGDHPTADASPLPVVDAAPPDAFEPFSPPPDATLSAIVYPGDDGRLVYVPDDRGNTIPDFSHAGYGGGGTPLPEVPVAVTLGPAPGDARARIQAAIDEVAALPPDAAGFRGAVLLGAGEYEIDGTLHIRASGVVLRGEGKGTDGTVLIATRRSQHTLVVVDGSGGAEEIAGSRVDIVGDYVPFGARSFQVANASSFSVGDDVVVYRPSTEAWISALGMDEIAPRDDGGEIVQWTAGAYDLHYQRAIAAIDGDVVTVDAPIVSSLDGEYGGGAIYRYRFDGRIANVGVESLRMVSEYRAGEETSDEDHAWVAVSLDRVEHAWVRDVVALHFGFAAVSVERHARYVTVQDCKCLDPVSEITGGRRYSFNVNGSFVLVQRCQTRGGRHDYVTGARVLGPNVFLDSDAVQTHADIGPHHRWATGLLFDNISGGEMNVQDRGNWGTGHGWAGAQVVFWNSTGASLACQSPPTAQNYSIGWVGEHSDGRLDREDGYWEAHGADVFPRSLYLWQLRDRLGMDAVRAVANESQLDEMAN